MGPTLEKGLNVAKREDVLFWLHAKAWIASKLHFHEKGKEWERKEEIFFEILFFFSFNENKHQNKEEKKNEKAKQRIRNFFFVWKAVAISQHCPSLLGGS